MRPILKVAFLRSFYRDFFKIKKSEELMQYPIDRRTQECGFRSIAERAHEPIAIVASSDKQITMINRAARLFLRLSQMSREALFAKIHDLLSRADFEKKKRIVSRLSGSKCVLVLTALATDPTRYLVEILRVK